MHKIENENVDDMERLRNFKRSVIFGPIFICSSCSRKLFENGVKKITEKFKTSVNEKKMDSTELAF